MGNRTSVTTHSMKPVERGYKRRLQAVSGSYVQDKITYRPGFWRQYGWQLCGVFLGLIVCLLMGVVVILDALQIMVVTGKGAKEGIFFMILTSITMTPLLVCTPFVWYRNYSRQIEVLEMPQCSEEESLRVMEVLE